MELDVDINGKKKEIEKVSAYLNLGESEINSLLKYENIAKGILKVDEEEYEAWRIIHNNSLGPGKGGIRFHPDTNEEEIKSLSFWMSLKSSLLRLPFGGAKGGVRINTKKKSKKHLQKVARAYVREFNEFLGENKDIPAPDVYTNSETIGWMLDEYEKINKRNEPAMITGKPLVLGGCSIRETATSEGGKIILDQFIKKLNKKPETTTIAVQGFGNAGKNIAKMLFKEGYNIMGVSDSKGGIKSEDAININELNKVKKEKGSVCDFTEAKHITNEKLLEMDVDFLVLAAMGNQITEKNANRIKASNILELANGPVTAEADTILLKRGVNVIPSILSSAGGVVASYCEWSMNKSGNILTKSQLQEIFNKKMLDAFHEVYELSKEAHGFDLRSAALAISIKRLIEAQLARNRI